MAATVRRMGSSTIMSTVLRFLTLFVVLLLNFNNEVHGFNVDLKSPFVFKSSDPNAYFGYSLAFYKAANSVFVGAPKSKENSQGNSQQWGAVYQCKISSTLQPCKLFKKVDDLDNNNANNRKDGQWMGATVYSDQSQILACAPRFSKISDNAEKEELLNGKCDYVSTSTSKVSDFVFNPCESISSRLSEFKTCQAGFSATIAVNVENVIYGGGPNIQLSRGKIASNGDDGNTYRFTPSQGLNFSDYMGYAVTSGRFTKDKKILLVGGAPRGNNLGGKVILYEFANADGKQYDLKVFSNIYDPSDPPQTGSYFGSVVASVDINGDGYADLVVGAPQYANTAPNQGAVYVYMNDKKDGLKFSKQVFYGDQGDGFFGYAIGSVGDLNGDGMQVGAPWAGKDGKGVVYLYYGSKSKETPLVLKQVITPADVNGGADGFDGFGFSFADFYPYSDNPLINNMDLTGYNELAIGAYRSGHIAVLRSRPVITLVGTISLGGITKIDLYSKDSSTICDVNGVKTKCIKNVKVCFQIPGSKGSDSLKYTINLDAEQVAAKRGYFIDGGGQEVSELSASVSDVTSSPKCAPDLTIYLKNNTKDILRPFGIVLTWEYTEQSCSAGSICPVQNDLLDSTLFTKIPYVKGCSNDGNDECNSDLQVTMDASVPPGGGKVIAIGVTEKVTVTVDIKNAGENAFINVLELVYPPVVSPNKVTIANFPGTVEWDPNVLADSDILKLRVKLSSPLKEKSTEKVTIVFSVLNVGKGNEVVFQAEAKTGSVEMNPKDNTYNVTLSATLSANLTVSGRVTPEQIKWDMKSKDASVLGPNIVHTFFFQNMGPSIAEESDVEINIPEMLDGSYMLNLYEVNLVAGAGVSGTIGTCNVKQEDLNPLKLDVLKKNTTKSTRRRRDVASERIDCADPKSCRVIKCKLNGLGKSQSATVTVKSTLVEATFDKLKESRRLVAFAKISSDFVKRPNNAPPDTVEVILSVNSPYLKVEKESDPIKWWVILLCILGAIIIIGLIVFLLYKKGFFKRKKHGEEEEEQEGLRKGDPDDEY